MKKKIFMMFFIFLNLFAEENFLKVNYKANEPLLGKGHYLILSDVPVATYANTIGYFSNVDIQGKVTPIQKDLEKVTIKKDGEIIVRKDVKWEQYIFELEDIDLGGTKVNFRWKSLNRQRIELMISEWNLVKNDYKLEIEYQYPDKTEAFNLNISMPEFNPDIYLDFDYKAPILKKQEYGKRYLILKKVIMNDYDLEITKNRVNSNGLQLDLKSEVVIKGVEDDGYEGIVKVVPLIESYPNIYTEISNENIIDEYKEFYIGLELPTDLNLNLSYKIEEEILNLSYNRIRRRILQKVILLPANNEVTKKVALDKWYIPGQKIYIDDFKNTRGYYLLEHKGELTGKYSNFKIKVGEVEEEIDIFGESEEIHSKFIRMKVEDGRVSICIDRPNELTQGTKFEYNILDEKDNLIEVVNLEFYIEN